MEEPPPPPPPHGEKPRTKRAGGLPDGNYDIFVIPPSSAGSGFLYLPSLNTQRNSFLAGCACTALAFFFYNVAVPVVKDWFYNTMNGGGSGVLMMVLGVGVVSWALGKTQGEGIGSTPSGGKSNSVPPKTSSESPPNAHSGHRAPSSAESEPNHDWSPPREPTPPPSPPPPGSKRASEPHFGPTPASDQPKGSKPEPAPQSPPQKPKSSWQKTSQTPDAKSAWEKAREETRKREEERKRAAEIQRRREELLKERERLREKETLERLEREWKEKKAKEEEETKKTEAELKAKQVKDEADKKVQREKERREREGREALLQAAKEAREAKESLEKARREEQERKEREEKEQKLAQKAAEDAAQHETEIKTAQARAADMRAEEARAAAAASARASNLSSNSKKPPMPSARTERDDDAYSFRPYDRPRTQKSSSGSVYSDDSYAQSASTARTTPPASVRGAYTTKDPDKIIIKGVYSFNNAFMRTPISQLISGQGNVTDGLILRITTEGLFIDDDVRGVPQREWDVKAWTLKLCESIELQGHLILRASIRDQEGKKYVFILTQTEGWKVAVGLQRLRKGSQVRALGVAGMPTNEARILLESLGWS